MELLGEKMKIFFVITLFWSLPWKGYALWVATKRNQRWWFIALLIVNTFAILEIIYIFLIVKKTWREFLKDLQQSL